MYGEKDAVAQAVTGFVDYFEMNKIDCRIGLLPYGGAGSYSYPKGTIKNNGNLTKVDAFKDELNKMAFDGGAEYSYLAMNKALNEYDWRPNAQHLMFLITDEPDHGTYYGNSNYTESDIIDAIMRRSNFSAYIVCTYEFLNAYDNFDNYESIRVYKSNKNQLVSTFNSIFEEINDEIANDYIIQYHSDNLITDNANNCRNVELTVNYQDPNNGNLTSRASGQYCLNRVVKIMRTTETEQLSNNPQRKNAPLEIGAFIYMENQSDADANSLTMTLYYAQCDSGSFNSLSMSSTNNDLLFQGTIPALKVKPPCIKYYLMARGTVGQQSWDIGKITYPADRPSYTPAVISIMPNIPPVITHQKPVSIKYNTSVTIEATVEDVTEKIKNVTLFYRKKGGFIYHSISKNTDETFMNFNATIPETITTDDFEYYLVATDNHDGTSQVGPFDIYVSTPIPADNMKSITLGNVIVYANEFPDDKLDSYIQYATGNVMIGTTVGQVPLIKSTTRLTINRNTRRIYATSSGELIALDVIRDDETQKEKLPLYSGNFEIDCLNNPPTIHFDGGESQLQLVQNIPFYYETQTKQVSLGSDQITLHGIYAQLDQGFNAKLLLGDIVLSQSNHTTKHCQYADSEKQFVHDRSKSMSITNLDFKFDLFAQKLDAKGELTISQIIGNQDQGISATFGCRQDPFSIQTISGAFQYANAPEQPVLLPQESNYSLSASVSNGIYWIDNLQHSNLLPVLKGYGEITFDDDDHILSTISQQNKQTFIHGNMLYTIDASAKTLMTGDMWLFDHIHLSNANLQFGLPYQINGYIDYQNILTGHLNTALWHSENRVELTGLSMLDWKIPLSTSFIGGFLLENQATYPLVQLTTQGIDKSVFLSNYALFFMNVSVSLNMNRDSDVQILGWKDITQDIEITKNSNKMLFHLNQSYPQIVIAAQCEKSTTNFDIQLPDETSYTPESVSPFLGNDSQFGMDVDNIFFIKNSFIHESFYGLNTPAEGEYQLTVNNAGRIGNYQIKLMVPNQMPSIQLIQPSTTLQVKSGQSVMIQWIDKDDDDNAKISLYLDHDNSGANGILVHSSIDENDDKNHYEWIVPDHIPDGTYYLYAMIFDNNHAPKFSYSPGQVQINNNNGNNIPEYVVAVSEEWGTTIYWNPVADTDILGYRLYVSDQTDQNNAVYDFAAGTDTTYALFDLKKDQGYQVSVSTVNSQGMESDLSQSQTFVSQTYGEGGNPDLWVNPDASSLKYENNQLTISAQIENSGNNDAYSARISCYYGAVLPQNLVATNLISQLTAQKMDILKFHYIEQAGIQGGKPIYITIDNVLPQEFTIENNKGIIENRTLFNAKNGLLFQSTNGYTFEIMPHRDSDYLISYLNTIPEESITNTTQQPSQLLYELIHMKTNCSTDDTSVELILPDTAPDHYNVFAYIPQTGWQTLEHSSDVTNKKVSIPLLDNASVDLDPREDVIEYIFAFSATTDSSNSTNNDNGITSNDNDSSSCFLSLLPFQHFNQE